MKQRLTYVLGLSLILMLILVACGGQPATKTEPAANEPAATSAPSEEEDAGSEEDADAEEESTGEEETAAQPTGPLPGEGKTVRMGRATWDTGWFQAEIFTVLLEQLGYEVDPPSTLDNPAFYLSTAKGDLDMWPNGWFPLHNNYIQEEDVADNVELVGYESRNGALQGYLIDKKTADELGITSLEDFKDPAIAEVFDGNGDGRADLIGCDPGWGCEAVIDHHIEAYDLSDTVEHVQGSYSALMGDTISRFKRGEPVLFYTWTPNWTVHSLVPGKDVVWIEVPFSSLPEDQKDLEDMTIGDDIEGCVANPCNLGFPPNDIRVVANSQFLQDNPEAKILFELVEIPLGDIAAQNAKMFEGEDSDEDIRMHAEEWVAANQEKVDVWINAALTGEMPEDMTDEDMTDEDMTDEDMTDEDMTDEDMTDEDMTDEDMTDEDMTDEEATDVMSGPLPGEGKSVSLGRATWDTGWFQVELLGALLERLGYEIESVETLDNAAFYLSTARGDIDMWPNGWFPNHDPFMEEEDVAGKVELVGYEVRNGALQGYLIDKKTADEYNITNIADLQDPELAALFDADGNGLADLVGCDPGWGCELMIEHHLDAYDLRDTIEHLQGSYNALMGDTISRYQRGEPVLYYTWTPSWSVGKLVPGEDVVWLETPFGSLPEEQKELEPLSLVAGVEGCANDPCEMGFPPNTIRIAANKEFLDENPEVRALASWIAIPLNDISAQNARMYDGEDSDDDIRMHAEEWIEANQETVDEWLSAAMAGEMKPEEEAEVVDATDEDMTDEDMTDEDMTDEDMTDEGMTDEDMTDEGMTDEEFAAIMDGPLPGEGVTYNVGRATWDTGWFQVELFAMLLEELGYEREDTMTLDNAAFYLSAARGEVDFWPNGWFPIHNPFIENDDVAGMVELVGYEVKAGALQGYLIDKKTAEEYNVTSLEDFLDPEIAALFDSDGNGKADLIGCDPGWGCELVIEHHLDAYGLRDSIDHIQGSYSALMADTITRYQNGESILFYTWTPNWTVNKLVLDEDVVWIEVPFSSLPEDQKEMEDMTTGEGIMGCVSDPCNMGFPPNDIRVVANVEFLEANPAANALFELVEIPLNDIASQNAKMFAGEDSDEDISMHAEEWIEANRSLVDEWLAEAMAAANE